MMIASTCGDDLRGKRMASCRIWGRWQVMKNACERSTETSETLGGMQGGGHGSRGCKLPTGSLENCRWLEMPRTTTGIHDQKNVFDSHENVSETRKVEAKLARCLPRTEGRTNQLSCEHDTCLLQGKTREEQYRFSRCIPSISRGAHLVVCERGRRQ